MDSSHSDESGDESYGSPLMQPDFFLDSMAVNQDGLHDSPGGVVPLVNGQPIAEENQIEERPEVRQAHVPNDQRRASVSWVLGAIGAAVLLGVMSASH